MFMEFYRFTPRTNSAHKKKIVLSYNFDIVDARHNMWPFCDNWTDQNSIVQNE